MQPVLQPSVALAVRPRVFLRPPAFWQRVEQQGMRVQRRLQRGPQVLASAALPA